MFKNSRNSKIFAPGIHYFRVADVKISQNFKKEFRQFERLVNY